MKKCPTKNVVRVGSSLGRAHTLCVYECFQLLFNFFNWGSLSLSAPIDFNLSSRKPEPLQSIELTISLALLAVIYFLQNMSILISCCASGRMTTLFREGNPMKIISINSNNPTIVNIKMTIKRQQATHDRGEESDNDDVRYVLFVRTLFCCLN